MDRIPRIGLSIMLIGLGAVMGSLALGDSLVATGVPCDRAPLANGTCTVLIATFWIGVALVIAGPIYIVVQDMRAIRKYRESDPLGPANSNGSTSFPE